MERLGATGQDAWDLALEPHRADKPRRMRWATYDRIVAEAAELEDRRLLALTPALERFLARVQRAAATSRARRAAPGPAGGPS